jgi:hypothetical integral membrane protein (TIGR02206 family)
MSSPLAFTPFGPVHWVTLCGIAAVALLLPLLARRLGPHARRAAAWTLAALLLGQEVAQLVWKGLVYGPSVELLPLQLCTLSVFLTAWTLLTGMQRTYEVAYFWGLGGSTQALATPDLHAGFPSWGFVFFFAGHGLVVTGVLYATLAMGLRPYPVSVLRVVAITLAVAVLVLLLNLVLGTNFMYLLAKPDHPSLLDWLGPWPWYLLGLVWAALVTFALLYAPFLVLDHRHRRHPR